LSATALGAFFLGAAVVVFSFGAVGFVTRPVATFFERGLDVLALVVAFLGPAFLGPDFLTAGTSSTFGNTRGFEWPVFARVVAIVGEANSDGETCGAVWKVLATVLE
jgi:hypothetical protein